MATVTKPQLISSSPWGKDVFEVCSLLTDIVSTKDEILYNIWVRRIFISSSYYISRKMTETILKFDVQYTTTYQKIWISLN